MYRLGTKSIRNRLFRFLACTLVGVAALFFVVWQWMIQPALRRGVFERQNETARRAADQIEEFIEHKSRELIQMGEASRFWDMRQDEQKQALYQLMKLDPQIREIAVADRAGQLLVRISRERVYTNADLIAVGETPKYRDPLIGNIYIGAVYHALTAEPFLTIGVPIRFAGAQTRGAIVAEIGLKGLWKSVANIQVGESGLISVINESGALIAHPDYSKVLTRSNDTPHWSPRDILAEFARGHEVTGRVITGPAGARWVVTPAPVLKTRWVVFVQEPEEVAFAAIRLVELSALVVLGIALIGMLAVSAFFSRRIAEPVGELEAKSKLVAEGQLDQKLEIHTGDEIESLANQFNRMAEALKESRQGLEEKIAERTRELSALYAVMTPLASSEPDRLLQQVVERLSEVTHAEAALIRIFDKERTLFVYPAHVGFPASYLEATRNLDDGSAIGRVFLTGEPIIAADIAQDPRVRAKRQLESGFQSCAFLPLRVSGKIRGIVHLASREIGHFNEDKITHLMAIAQQMGIAMENRELFEESRQRAQEQEALNAIATATSQSLHLDELLQISLDRVLDLMGREQGYIRLKDPVTGTLRLAAHRGISKEYIDVLLDRRTPGGKGDQVFESGEVLVINDTEAESLKEETRREGVHSLIWVPLKARGKVVGLMNVTTNRPIPFAAREVDLLQAIGNVIGVALENARLFEETQHSLERIQALREIDQAITSTLDLRTVLDVLMEKIDLVLPYSATTVRLFNQASGLLEPIACRNLDEKEWKADQWKGGRGIPNVVFETKAPWTVSNVQIDPRVRDAEFFAKHRLVSYLGVPLIVKDEILGVLGFYTREEHDFSAEEVEFLTTLAGQAAIAIHNSQLFNEATQAEASLARKVTELNLSNAELEQFAYVASHDLQEPLRMVRSYTSLLARRYQGKLDADADEFIAYAVDGAQRMQELINDLLRYSRVETTGKDFTATDCERILARTLTTLGLAIQESGVRVCHEPLPTVSADEVQLGQLFQNLIGNGIKYRREGPLEIDVGCRLEGSHWLFSVRDNGIGIEPQYHERIFTIFQRLHTREQYPGSGIGLAICKKIVERHRGKIWVESEPGKGSTFYFTLPATAGS